MEGGVKFIFKTLIKVPIIILITYAIFNVFAFAFTYFKLVGFSYVVLQTVVENNYIPPQEEATLLAYANSMVTGVVDNIKIGCDVDSSNGISDDITANPGENRKVQYGREVTVSVSGHYRFIWPLSPKEQRTGQAASGMTGQNTGAALSDAELDAARAAYADNVNNNIVITYVVPGLQYYPDLSS